MTSTVDFLKLIEAPWRAFQDHPTPETRADYCEIGDEKQGRGPIEREIYLIDLYGLNNSTHGAKQRARRDLIVQAPAMYAYVAMMAEQGDTQAKMILRDIHEGEA